MVQADGTMGVVAAAADLRDVGAKADDDKCLVVDSRAATDTQHKEDGLWAVDTYNGNCWGGGFDYAKRSSADIVLLQECRVFGSGVPECEQAARTHKLSAAISACNRTEKEGASAGVAVTVRSHIGMAEPAHSSVSEVEAARFNCKWLGMMCRGGIHVGSIWRHCRFNFA